MIDPALPFPIPHLRIQTTNHRAKSVERSSEFTFSNFIRFSRHACLSRYRNKYTQLYAQPSIRNLTVVRSSSVHS